MQNYLFLLIFALLLQGHLPAYGEALLEGNLTQGGLATGKTEPGSRVQLDGQDLRVSPKGYYIVGFGRDAGLRHDLTVTSPAGITTKQAIQVAPRHYLIERIEGISRQLMHPSPAELERISAEAQLVRQARDQSSGLGYFREPFIWPVMGRVSGVYGSQRIFNGEPRRPHYGVDIAAPRGTLVRAPAGGIVTLSHAGMFFSGKTLILDHGLGLSSSFLHLDKILVKVGDRVEQGTPLAEVGATGRVTGPHLDWRVNWFQERLDPALLVPAMPAVK